MLIPVAVLSGESLSRWRVLRTSNAYAFRDPNPATASRSASKSEIPSGTVNQRFLTLRARQESTALSERRFGLIV